MVSSKPQSNFWQTKVKQYENDTKKEKSIQHGRYELNSDIKTSFTKVIWFVCLGLGGCFMMSFGRRRPFTSKGPFLIPTCHEIGLETVQELLDGRRQVCWRMEWWSQASLCVGSEKALVPGEKLSTVFGMVMANSQSKTAKDADRLAHCCLQQLLMDPDALTVSGSLCTVINSLNNPLKAIQTARMKTTVFQAWKTILKAGVHAQHNRLSALAMCDQCPLKSWCIGCHAEVWRFFLCCWSRTLQSCSQDKDGDSSDLNCWMFVSSFFSHHHNFPHFSRGQASTTTKEFNCAFLLITQLRFRGTGTYAFFSRYGIIYCTLHICSAMVPCFYNRKAYVMDRRPSQYWDYDYFRNFREGNSSLRLRRCTLFSIAHILIKKHH